ncbi:hypothetical protein ACW9YQ_24880 (plasmid) [Paraburkholderia strydomiana]
MPNDTFSVHAFAQARQAQDTRDAASELEEILALARDSGMLITLDGQIGREKYQSIAGSLHAFKRFVDALCNNFGQRAAT